MAIKDQNTLRTQAQTIKNETARAANTAVRIGGTIEDIVDSVPSLASASGWQTSGTTIVTNATISGLTKLDIGGTYNNIFIGQNNASNLIPVGEFQGGKNVFIGTDIANTWSGVTANQATHNILIGRNVANNTNPMGYSVAIGYEAYSNITGVTPTAVGYDVAIGMCAMQGFKSKGGNGADDENVAIGKCAMKNAGPLTSQGGGSNIGIGKEVLMDAEVEYYNVAMGWKAAYNSSLGRGNIALGACSLTDTTGATDGNIGTGCMTYNVAIGVHTLQHSFGNQNIAIGVDAFSGYGQNPPSVMGDYNIAIGANSAKIVTGDFNTFLGGYSGARANGVQNQVALVGDRNTFIGAGATFTDAQPVFSDSIFIGSDYAQTMASNTIYIGSPTQDVVINSGNLYDGSGNTIGGLNFKRQTNIATGTTPTLDCEDYNQMVATWELAETASTLTISNFGEIVTIPVKKTIGGTSTVTLTGTTGIKFVDIDVNRSTIVTFVDIVLSSGANSFYEISLLYNGTTDSGDKVINVKQT